MHLDSTLRRVARAAEGTGTVTVGAVPMGIVFVLAASLAGCVGSIDTGKPSDRGGGPTPPSSGSGGGTGGSSAVMGPSACKADQIGFSPMRRLTRIQYDNS